MVTEQRRNFSTRIFTYILLIDRATNVLAIGSRQIKRGVFMNANIMLRRGSTTFAPPN